MRADLNTVGASAEHVLDDRGIQRCNPSTFGQELFRLCPHRQRFMQSGSPSRDQTTHLLLRYRRLMPPPECGIDWREHSVHAWLDPLERAET